MHGGGLDTAKTFTHVIYYNYHHLVTVQMSKPRSQLFCLSLLPSVRGRDGLSSHKEEATSGVICILPGFNLWG